MQDLLADWATGEVDTRRDRNLAIRLNPTTAPIEEVAAQRLLHARAAGAAEHATACGVAITHRIGFQALVEPADATLGPGIDLLDLATDPAQVAAALPTAVRVLHQTSLATGADAAAGLLAADGPHAPIGPTGQILAHHYSPLLGAVQLHSVRHQLTTDQQLMFRTGHPLPRYPAITTRDNRRRLRLPAHRPHWPEPDPARIPQTLWWNAVPTPLARHASSAPVASMLAMGLAKTGSTHGWTTIAGDLDLPATHATRIVRLTRYLQRNGAWPEILAALERLMTGLQQRPPPIDYPARRDTAHNLALRTAAVEHGRRRHPSAVPVETLTRQFWERFTGGDIAYAPTPISIDPKLDQ